jgi:hypothetical protein
MGPASDPEQPSTLKHLHDSQFPIPFLSPIPELETHESSDLWSQPLAPFLEDNMKKEIGKYH